MGCHWCADETFAILALLTGVRYLPAWARAIWGTRHRKPACRHEHEHKEAL
jgi:hypothetical protein